MIKLPREDGAWWMALTCLGAGWAAAARWAWEPLALLAGLVSLFAAAQHLRSWRRLGAVDPAAARRSLLAASLGLVLPAAALAVFALKVRDAAWIAAIGVPGALYAPALLAGAERRPWARVLAVVALTGAAPAAYGAAAGSFGRPALLLWASLGGYFLVGALFVMARLRRSSAVLRLVRVLAPAAGAVLWAGSGPWLAAPFLLVALRSWMHRGTDAPVDPRRLGHAEIGYAFAAAGLVLAGFWLR